MKRAAALVFLLFITVLFAVSCGASADDGVVIVPSSRGDAVTTAAVTETLETTASETVAVTMEDAVQPETEAVTEEAAADSADIMERAQEMLNEAEFIALLEQYGIDAADPNLTGAVAAVLAYQNVGSADSAADAVLYWTDGGSVWHVTRDCSALAKSKAVQSGTEAEALANGKTRVCKRCGG